MPEQLTPLRPSVGLLLATVAVVGANSLSLGPIAPDIAAGLSSPVNAVLTASAAYGFGTAFSAFFLARYIDRTGVRTTLVRSTALLTLSMLASAMAGTAMWLSVAQFAAGIGAGVALPCCYAGAAAIAPPNQQNRVLGIVLAGWTVSMVAGVGLAALIAEHTDWRAVYCLLALLSGATCFGITRSPLPDIKRKQPADHPMSAMRIRGVPSLLFLVVCYMIAFYGVYNFLGDYVVSALQKSVGANAWLTVAYGLGFGFAASFASVLDRLTASRTSAFRIRPHHLPLIGLAALAVVYMTIGLAAANYLWLIPVSALWGLANHLALNLLLAALNDADENRRGSVMGLYSCVTYLSLSAGTLLYGLLYTGSNLLQLCLLSAVVCISAATAGFVLVQRQAPGSQQKPV